MRRWLLGATLLLCVSGVQAAVRGTATSATRIEGNSGTKTITVIISQTPQNFAVAYDYTTVDGTATAADNDYIPTSGTLIIPAGSGQGSIEVQYVGDTRVEADEDFSLVVQNVADSPFIFTLINDDAPSVTVSNPVVLEGNGPTQMAFDVTLSAPASTDVLIAYATNDITATAGVDYQPLEGTLTFAPGEVQKTIVVTVNGDTAFENDETLGLTVQPSVNGKTNGAVANATGTIVNDDAPSVTVSSPSVAEGNSGTTTMTFDLSLAAPPPAAVLTSYSTSDVTATAGTDYLGAQGTVTFAAGETQKSVAVTINGDTTFEPDETFTLTVQPTAGAVAGTPSSGTGTILNDDQRAAARVSVVGGGGQQGVLGQQLAQPLTVQVVDQTGAPLPGVLVQWRVTEGAAQLEPATSTTDAQGHASTRVTLQSVGTVTVEASVAGLTPVTFTLSSATSFADRAQGPVAVPIARVLDAVCARNEETFTRVCRALARLDNGALTSALERVAPQHSGAQAKVATEVVATVTSGIAARLSALRNGAERFSIQRLSLNSHGRPIPVATLASLLFASDGPSGAGEEGSDYNGWSAFLSGNLGDGERVTHPGELGFDLKSRGVMFGVDRQIGDGGVVGASVNWSSLDTELERGAGSVDTRSYALSLYGSRAGLLAGNTPAAGEARTHYDGLHLDGSLTYGRNRFDSEHLVDIAGEPLAVAKSSNDANLFAIGAATGIDAHRGRTEFDGTLSGTWSRADVDDLTEDGPGPLILFVDGHEVESLTGSAALNVRSTFATSFGTITPSVRGELLHEFRSGARLVTAHFLKDRFGTSFTIPIDQADANYGRIGAALQAGFPRGWTAFVEATQDVLRSDLHFRSLQFNIQKSF